VHQRETSVLRVYVFHFYNLHSNHVEKISSMVNKHKSIEHVFCDKTTTDQWHHDKTNFYTTEDYTDKETKLCTTTRFKIKPLKPWPYLKIILRSVIVLCTKKTRGFFATKMRFGRLHNCGACYLSCYLWL